MQNNTKINENKRKENIGANEDDLHNSHHTSTILKLEKSTVKVFFSTRTCLTQLAYIIVGFLVAADFSAMENK